MSSPSSDIHAQVKKTKRVRGVPARSSNSSVSSSPAGAQPLATAPEPYTSPRPVEEHPGDGAVLALVCVGTGFIAFGGIHADSVLSVRTVPQ
jgi:hypothetical protein